MANTLSRIKPWVELLRDVVQVLALLFAAWWAYDKFWKTEGAGLRERMKVEMSLDWTSAPEPTHCIGSFQVTLQNIGKSDIDFKSSRLRVWLVPFLRSDSDKPIRISSAELVRDVQPLYDETLNTFSESAVLAIKRPDEKGSAIYDFLFKKEPHKIAVFHFDAIERASGHIAHADTWDYVCGREVSRH
jgi:hypothetical protein